MPAETTVTSQHFHHVDYRWSGVQEPSRGLDQLVNRSNLLGADPKITNTGGGNTSMKSMERDPATGGLVGVLWVKGSGGDLHTATSRNFAALHLSKLQAVKEAYEKDPARGLKTPAEDAVVDLYRQCALESNAVAPSIDTPLHAFLPARNVDHTHPNAVIAIAATRRSRELTKEVFGGEVGWLPWMRPGMELALSLEQHVRRHPEHVGVVLAQHGLINWADDGKGCYDQTLSLIERAARFVAAHDKGPETFGGPAHPSLDEPVRERLLSELLPWLRQRISQSGRSIATVEMGSRMLDFVNSKDAPRLAQLGTSCPDHFLRTKLKPHYVRWDPQRHDVNVLRDTLDEQLAAYRQEYRRYYEAHRRVDSPAMRDPSPAIVLLPGVGMIAWGKNKTESRIAAECYNCAVEVMRGAEAIDEYAALSPAEAFDIEYWALEEAKLRRMPPEGRLAGNVVVVVVVGGGSAVGEILCAGALEQSAHGVYAEASADEARAVVDGLLSRFGSGIGVAGSGVSACGKAVGTAAQLADEGSRRRLYRTSIMAYGGADHLVVVRPPTTGDSPLGRLIEEWVAIGGDSVTEIEPTSSSSYAVRVRRRSGGSSCELSPDVLATAVVDLIGAAAPPGHAASEISG